MLIITFYSRLLRWRVDLPSPVFDRRQDLRVCGQVEVRRGQGHDRLRDPVQAHRQVDRDWILGDSSNGD